MRLDEIPPCATHSEIGAVETRFAHTHVECGGIQRLRRSETYFITSGATEAIGQITALSTLAATRSITVDEVMKHFAGARRDLVSRHLETLAILGELHLVGEGRYTAPPVVA